MSSSSHNVPDSSQQYTGLSHALSLPNGSHESYSVNSYHPVNQPVVQPPQPTHSPHVAETRSPEHQGSLQPVQPTQPPPPPPEGVPGPDGVLKRKRGRPKGSKTKRRHIEPASEPPSSSSSSAVQNPASNSGTHPVASTSTSTPPVPATTAPEVPKPPAQTSEAISITNVYEFQWRALSLCAEFYEAAGDLVRATPASVLAECLGNKVDPLKILNDAKKACDILLANPSTAAASTGPPPPYLSPTTAPQYPPPIPQRSALSTPPQPPQSTPDSSASNSTPSLPVSNSVNSSVASSSTSAPAALPQPPVATPEPQSTFAPIRPAQNVVHGTWKEEEVDRLKTLVEQSRKRNSHAEPDWDWVVEQWGDNRSRHQILIKATSLGLKPTSTHPSRLRKQTGYINAEVANKSPNPPQPQPQPQSQASSASMLQHSSSHSAPTSQASAPSNYSAPSQPPTPQHITPSGAHPAIPRPTRLPTHVARTPNPTPPPPPLPHHRVDPSPSQSHSQLHSQAQAHTQQPQQHHLPPPQSQATIHPFMPPYSHPVHRPSHYHLPPPVSHPSDPHKGYERERQPSYGNHPLPPAHQPPPYSHYNHLMRNENSHH